MNNSFDILPARTQRAWRDAQAFDYVAEQSPQVIDTGDFNQVLLFEEVVLRVPRGELLSARAALEYESELSFMLSEAHEQPPVEVPQLLEVQYSERPYYMLISRLPGAAYTPGDLRQLSVAEKRCFGSKIGAFIAWYAGALDLSTTRDLVRWTGVRLPDRLDTVKECANLVLHATDIHEALADVLWNNYQQYLQYKKDGVLEPTIVGHDDLHVGNLTFTQAIEGREVSGVLDFGNTRLSTPERELRHIAHLGDAALSAAINSYETATGATVSRELIHFWATAQAGTILASRLKANCSNMTDSISRMSALHPDVDWSQAFVKV